MAIEITSNTILKQCSSSPPHPLSETTVPLTVFDLAAQDLHIPTLYVFRAPMPSNDDLKDGLAKVLVNYPHLSGRMVYDSDGKQCFDLNNAGVRFIETMVSSSLSKKLPLEETTDLEKLLPPVEGVEELLQVQLNRYTCGGLVIGVTSHHRVADGQSMSQFLVAWSEIIRNSTTTSPLPFHDRSLITVPRNPPFCEFDLQEFETKTKENPTRYPSDTSIVSFIVHYSSNFIAKLKSKVPERSSTFECLLAHLWKKITIARELPEDEHTEVWITVNGRERMNPKVPQYFGNLVLCAKPNARAGKLVHLSHAEIVRMIRDEVRRIDDGYIKSFIDYKEMTKGTDRKLEESVLESGSSFCPNLEVDSWLRFNFHDLDFGSGGPCSFLPPNLPVWEGEMLFVPSCKEKGEVDVFMALFVDHVDMFNKICYDLD